MNNFRFFIDMNGNSRLKVRSRKGSFSFQTNKGGYMQDIHSMRLLNVESEEKQKSLFDLTLLAALHDDLILTSRQKSILMNIKI